MKQQVDRLLSFWFRERDEKWRVRNCLACCEAVYEEDAAAYLSKPNVLSDVQEASHIYFSQGTSKSDDLTPFFIADTRPAGKSLEPLVDGHKDCIILACRGTATRSDVIADLQAYSSTQDKRGKIHKGFDDRAKRIPISDLVHAVRSQGRSLVITGHSLGGAVAMLLFGRVCDELEKDGLESRVHLVTFGCPLVGDICFSEYMKAHVERIIHVVHKDDIVTRALAVSNELLRKHDVTGRIGSKAQEFVKHLAKTAGSESFLGMFAEIAADCMPDIVSHVASKKTVEYAFVGRHLQVGPGMEWEFPKTSPVEPEHIKTLRISQALIRGTPAHLLVSYRKCLGTTVQQARYPVESIIRRCSDASVYVLLCLLMVVVAAAVLD